MTPPVGTTPEGILLVDKPIGMSSHALVSRVRRALGHRKIGHAGTLDPDATGLLVLGVGRATRLLGYLTASEKSYTSVIRLGVSTDTDDAAGEVQSRTSCAGVTDEEVRRALADQVGDIDQVPSSVSAVKVDGRRAYARVRAGETVALPPRRVRIHSLEVAGISRSNPDPGDGPDLEAIDVAIEVRCSAGTYIRAIARDVGRLLGVGGHVVELRRIDSGAFTVADAHRIEDIEVAGQECRRWLIPLREAAARSLPTVEVAEPVASAIRHGRVVPWPDPAQPQAGSAVALVDDSRLVAIAECVEGRTRYLAVFD